MSRRPVNRGVSFLSVLLLVLRVSAVMFVASAPFVFDSSKAAAHSVGLRNTRVFLSPDTAEMLTTRAASGGGGVQAGDVLEYIIEFEPYENGAQSGPGGWVTFYPPSWARVVGASFVDFQGNDFVDVPVGAPGAMWDGVGPNGSQVPFGAPFDTFVDGSLAQLYGDTGIFFSTSADTAKYVGGADPDTTALGGNGYVVDPTACGQLIPNTWSNCWAHNLWDKEMTDRMGTGGGSIIDAGRNTTPYLAGSPVAGPQTYYGLDYTGATGPWQRVQYPGSLIGTGPAPDPNDKPGPAAPTVSTAWVPVTPGVNDGVVLSEGSPLPDTTTAVRFAVGALDVLPGLDDLMWTKVRIEVASAPAACTIVDAEVFGGDGGSDDNGKDNPWRYYVPIAAVNSACLTIHKVGPELVLGGGTVQYDVTFANTSPDTITNVTVTDILDPSLTGVTASDGGVVNGGLVTWPVIPTLTPGESRTYTVTATAPAAPNTLLNEATIASDLTSPVSSLWETGVVTDIPPSISVTKTPSPASVDEPGGPVTFTVDVENTSAETLTFDALGDDVYGDLFDVGNLDVTGNTCLALSGTTIDPGATATCSFDVDLVGGFGDPDHTNTVTATASDGDANQATDSAVATVSFGDVAPSVLATKTPDPGVVPDGGGPVTFTVDVENTSVEAVTFDALGDDVYGDLFDGGNPNVSLNTCAALSGTTIDPGSTVSCSFDGDVAGSTGDPDHVNTVTVEVSDDDGSTVTATDTATVAIGVASPTLVVTKTPSVPSVDEPGATVTFTVEVENTSAEPLTFDALIDDMYGDLFDADNPEVANSTCPVAAGVEIGDGGTVTCSFDVDLVGGFGDPDHTNTVTATASDADANEVTAEGSATVSFTDVLPTVGVDKRTDGAVVAAPGETVTFTVEVENASPESVTIDAMVDSLYGDLFDAGTTAVSENTCPDLVPLTLAEGESATCSFDAEVDGEVGDPDHENTVTVDASDDDGNTVQSEDTVTMEFVAGTGDVEGLVFEDQNENGLHDADEPGIPDVEITLTDAAGAVTVVTGADGRWFATVAAGEVTLAVDDATVPEGWTLTTANDGQTFDAVGGETTEADDIGYLPATAITGFLFEDLDNDGFWDDGEPGIVDVDMAVTDSDGTRTATTGSDGTWTLAVAPGAITVIVETTTVPAGMTLTTANESQVVEVAGGTTTDAEDVGYHRPDELVSISGEVWLDLDGDGSWDAFEPPIPGVEVGVIDGAGDLVVVVTGADGWYSATGLAAGTVTVAVDGTTLPDGLVVVVDPDAVVDGATSVSVGGGVSLPGLDFAYRGTGSIGDTVWVDADGDGDVDEGEDRISGAVVTLRWAGFDGSFGTSDDVTFPAATSGADGTYLFGGLPPGQYTVRIDLNSVSDGLTLSTLSEVGVTLEEGMVYLFGDFGFVASDEALPYTGMPVQELLTLATMLMALGAWLLVVARRRSYLTSFAMALRRLR